MGKCLLFVVLVFALVSCSSGGPSSSPESADIISDRLADHAGSPAVVKDYLALNHLVSTDDAAAYADQYKDFVLEGVVSSFTKGPYFLLTLEPGSLKVRPPADSSSRDVETLNLQLASAKSFVLLFSLGQLGDLASNIKVEELTPNQTVAFSADLHKVTRPAESRVTRGIEGNTSGGFTIVAGVKTNSSQNGKTNETYCPSGNGFPIYFGDYNGNSLCCGVGQQFIKEMFKLNRCECPKDQALYNVNGTYTCLGCPAGTVAQNGQCVACPPGLVPSPRDGSPNPSTCGCPNNQVLINGVCQPPPPPPPGSEFCKKQGLDSDAQGNCIERCPSGQRTIGGKCFVCPAPRSWDSNDINKPGYSRCSCGGGLNFDEASNSCVSCGPNQVSTGTSCVCKAGFTPDPEGTACYCPLGSFLDEKGACVPLNCRADQVPQGDHCVCRPGLMSDPEGTACTCPVGSVLDDKGVCVPQCAPPKQINPITKACELTCAPNQVIQNGQCVTNCPEAESWDETNHMCIPKCTVPWVYNGSTKTCELRCGPSTIPENGSCRSMCGANERWDAINHMCIPLCGHNQVSLNGFCVEVTPPVATPTPLPSN